MSTGKLTLSVKPELIEKAKRYAYKRHTNLSKMVQTFFEKVTENEQNLDERPERELTPEILALTGVVKGNYTDEDIDNMKYEYLSEKYGLK